MGAGLPSGLMAACLNPERRVMVVTGDGGFMMNSQELETAVRLGLNLVVVPIDYSENTRVLIEELAEKDD